MTRARRLERLEEEHGGTEWQVWQQDNDNPDVFHCDGRTLSRADLESEPGNKILVHYVDTPLGEKESAA